MSDFTGNWAFLNRIAYAVPRNCTLKVCDNDEARLHIDFGSEDVDLIRVDDTVAGKVVFTLESDVREIGRGLKAFCSMLVSRYCVEKAIEQGGDPSSVKVSDFKYDGSFKSKLTFDQLADMGSKIGLDEMMDNAGVKGA